MSSFASGKPARDWASLQRRGRDTVETDYYLAFWVKEERFNLRRKHDWNPLHVAFMSEVYVKCAELHSILKELEDDDVCMRELGYKAKNSILFKVTGNALVALCERACERSVELLNVPGAHGKLEHKAGKVPDVYQVADLVFSRHARWWDQHPGYKFVTALLVSSSGRLLLGKAKDKNDHGRNPSLLYKFPGGWLDCLKDESTFHGLIRELFEESGACPFIVRGFKWISEGAIGRTAIIEVDDIDDPAANILHYHHDLNTDPVDKVCAEEGKIWREFVEWDALDIRTFKDTPVGKFADKNLWRNEKGGWDKALKDYFKSPFPRSNAVAEAAVHFQEIYDQLRLEHAAAATH